MMSKSRARRQRISWARFSKQDRHRMKADVPSSRGRIPKHIPPAALQPKEAQLGQL
jgi:hypothetical protein